MGDIIWFIIVLVIIILVIWLLSYVIATHKPQKGMSEKEIDRAMEQMGHDLGYMDEIETEAYHYDEIEAIDDEFIQYKTPDLVFDKKQNKYVNYSDSKNESSGSV